MSKNNILLNVKGKNVEQLLDARIKCEVEPWIGIQFSVKQAIKLFSLMDDHQLSEHVNLAGRKTSLLKWNNKMDHKNVFLDYDAGKALQIENEFGANSDQLKCFVPAEWDGRGKSVAGTKSEVNSCHMHSCNIAQILAKIVSIG